MEVIVAVLIIVIVFTLLLIFRVFYEPLKERYLLTRKGIVVLTSHQEAKIVIHPQDKPEVILEKLKVYRFSPSETKKGSEDIKDKLDLSGKQESYKPIRAKIELIGKDIQKMLPLKSHLISESILQVINQNSDTWKAYLKSKNSDELMEESKAKIEEYLNDHKAELSELILDFYQKKIFEENR